MKLPIKILIITLLIILHIYVCNITNIPNNIILFKGEELKVDTAFGLQLNANSKYVSEQVSASIGNRIPEDIGKSYYKLSLFNTVPIKDIEVDVIPQTKIIPVGKIIGIKLYTKGILVVGLSEEGDRLGIKEGDTIISVNEEEVSTTEELINSVNKGNGEDITITYDRDGEIKVANIRPVKNDEGQYKLGLWVRDAAAGVGTLTYYEPSSKMFVALGHGIQDVDTRKTNNN